MDGLTGLQGLNGPVRLLESPEDVQATAEQRSGNAVDPRHGNWGEQAAPYPWQSSLAMGGSHGPYGPENALLDDEYWWSLPAGSPEQNPTMDRTPYLTHAAPAPKGVLSGRVPGDGPDFIADQLAQSYAIHGIRGLNAGAKGINSEQGWIQQDQWSDFWVMNPGDTRLGPLPRQQMSSHFMFGSRDRTQTFAQQNGYDFDSAHMHRRYATGAIPGNTMWMKPGGRPLVKNIPTTARPAIGAGSPFEGDDTMFDFNPYGAVLMATPTEYNPPATPTVVPFNTNDPNAGPAEVEWY